MSTSAILLALAAIAAVSYAVYRIRAGSKPTVLPATPTTVSDREGNEPGYVKPPAR